MKNDNPEDFSGFIDNKKMSRKERLIEKCKKHDVSIFVDDESETSSGIYAELRAVAPEAELERRLNSNRALSMANRSNIISLIALLIAVVALVK